MCYRQFYYNICDLHMVYFTFYFIVVSTEFCLYLCFYSSHYSCLWGFLPDSVFVYILFYLRILASVFIIVNSAI